MADDYWKTHILYLDGEVTATYCKGRGREKEPYPSSPDSCRTTQPVMSSTVIQATKCMHSPALSIANAYIRAVR
jgi:hypothetical protein